MSQQTNRCGRPPYCSDDVDRIVTVHYDDAELEPLSAQSTVPTTAAVKSSDNCCKWWYATHRKAVILLIALLVTGVSVGVPLALIQSSNHGTASVDGPVANAVQTSGNGSNSTSDPGSIYIHLGLELSLFVTAPTTAVGYDSSLYGSAWSADRSYAVSYQCSNVGSVNAFNVTLALTVPPSYMSIAFHPKGPYVEYNGTTPSTFTIPTLSAGSTQNVTVLGGWYEQQETYDFSIDMTYISSMPQAISSSKLASSQTVVVGKVVVGPSPLSTVSAASPPVTAAATVPTNTVLAQVYVPSSLPAAAWNESAHVTMVVSPANLNVITQAGTNNFRRSHYYDDESLYISPTQAAAGPIVNKGNPYVWEANTTALMSAAKQQWSIENGMYRETFKAQPLIWNGHVLLGGDLNNMFLLDAETGTLAAYADLGVTFNQVVSFQNYNGDVCGNQNMIGALGTPVIDNDAGIAYVMSKTYSDQSSTELFDAVFKLHALQLPTLVEVSGWPVLIEALQYRTATFEPAWQQSRGSLSLINGVVYAGFGSQCDYGTYRGWIVGVSVASQVVVQVWAGALAADAGSGIWGTGTGLSSDSNGRIFASTGNVPVGDGRALNGVPNADDAPMAANTPNWQTLDNSVIQFDTATLTPQLFFTPANSGWDSANDQDMGASGIALIEGWSTRYPQMGVVGGKNSTLYLFNANTLGGYKMASDGTNDILAEVDVVAYDSSGVRIMMLNSPAVSDADQLIYVALEGDQLYAYRYVESSTGAVTLELAGQSRLAANDVLGGGCSAPIIVSNGNAGSAVAWISYGQGVYAFDAIPDSTGVLNKLNFVGLYDAQRYAEPGFYAGGVIAGSDSGFIRRFQFT